MDSSEKDVWHRPEYEGRMDELAGRMGFEQLKSLRKGTMSARFRDYADRVPAVVVERWRSGLYPEQMYVIRELEELMDSIKGHRNPRTPAQRAAATVARYERAVETAESRVSKHRSELGKAERHLSYCKKQLKLALAELDMEVETQNEKG